MPACRRLPALLVLVLLLSGCAGKAEPAEPFRDRALLTHEDLNSGTVNYPSAYEAVESLRSNWLRVRGVDSPNSPSRVWVYLNNMRLGGVESLRGIATSEISFIRFYDAASAGARWGRDVRQGVIFVSTERQ